MTRQPMTLKAWIGRATLVSAVLLFPNLPAIAADSLSLPITVLQGLNKVTARVERIEVRVGQTVSFGALDITVRACRKSPPEDPPERAAFLEIQEIKPDEGKSRLFSGWMFASSPALSALENPVYDVWVLDCKAEPGGQ